MSAEESGSLVTCRAIIKETMDYGMDETLQHTTDEHEKNKEMRKIWKENAEECVR